MVGCYSVSRFEIIMMTKENPLCCEAITSELICNERDFSLNELIKTFLSVFVFRFCISRCFIMFILQLWCYFYSVWCSKVLWRSNQRKMRENFFCAKSNNAVLVNGIKGETICNLLHSLALNNEIRQSGGVRFSF